MPPHIADLALAYYAADLRWREAARNEYGVTWMPSGLSLQFGSPDTPLRAAFLACHAALTAWIDAKLKQEAGE